MTVYFVVLNEIMSGTIASQVLLAAKSYALALPAVEFRIVFLEPARVTVQRAVRVRLRQLRALWPAGKVTLAPYVGRLGAFAPAMSLKLLLRRDLLALHCRGPEAAIQGSHAARGRARVIFDSRGATDHETELRLSVRGHDAATIRRSAEYALNREREAAALVDAITAVGEPLADRYRDWTGTRTVPIAVVPCSVERTHFSPSARERRRQELGLTDDDLLVVHTSTSAQWEAFADVVEFFRGVAAAAPRASRLLFLSRLPAEVVTASLAPDDPLRRSIDVRTVGQTEVPEFLSAADAGVLLRRPHESFKAGNPIKFAEYLAAGLAVAVSEGIGTAADVVREHAVGVALPSPADDGSLRDGAARLCELLAADRAGVRRRAIELCESRYVWNRHVGVMARLYGYESCGS